MPRSLRPSDLSFGWGILSKREKCGGEPREALQPLPLQPTPALDGYQTA